MKKIFSLMVMSLFVFLPMLVNAESNLNFTCGDFDAEGIRTCTVVYNIDEANPQDSVSVKLTEHGGAEVTSINGVSDSDFSISTQNEVDGVWSIVLISPEAISGSEVSLLTFKYKHSGTEDCKISISIGNDNKDVTTPATPDEPTDNVQTGSTLPYIALGGIAIIAVGTYLATKNKAKMYKI